MSNNPISVYAINDYIINLEKINYVQACGSRMLFYMKMDGDQYCKEFDILQFPGFLSAWNDYLCRKEKVMGL